MIFNLEILISWFVHYKYLIIFPAAVIEGPIVTVVAGFLSSLGNLNFFLAWAVVVSGDVVGDIAWYGLGRFGGRGLVDRWGHYVGITSERVERLEDHFGKHGGKTLMLGKISHGVGGTILVAAGVARTAFWEFVWYNFIASIPKSLLLLLIGFYFGQALSKINSYLEFFGAITIMLGLVFAAVFIARKYGK